MHLTGEDKNHEERKKKREREGEKEFTAFLYNTDSLNATHKRTTESKQGSEKKEISTYRLHFTLACLERNNL